MSAAENVNQHVIIINTVIVNIIMKCLYVFPGAMSSQKLYDACESGRVTEVIRLLDAGADVDYVNKDYFDSTPLIIAAWSGHSPVVRVLLQQGAEVNTGAKDGEWSCLLS